jgi:hypothetical protein
MVEEVKKGIKGIRIPTKRVGDTIGDDLFKKKVMQAGFDSLSEFNEAFKAAGGDLGDAANKTRFLNSYLPKEEAPYRNIITDRIKSKYEILSGGATPGTKGAPENKVYWQAASAAEKEAIEKFPKDTKVNKQKRLTYVKRYLKDAGVPAKWLLNNLPKMGLYATAGAAAPISALASAMLYVGTSKPAMGALPEESLKDKVLRDIDFSAPSANAQLLEQMSQDAVMKAGGGMMNMNEMIRPIGYDIGGIVPKEKPSPDIKPKEKPVNFNAIMAEFDTPEAKAGQREPTGIEKIIADVFPVDPRSTMEDKIKAMLGMGGGGGSILDDAMDIKTLGMIAELQGVLSFDEIDKMKNMSPIEIEILYNKTFGEEK